MAAGVATIATAYIANHGDDIRAMGQTIGAMFSSPHSQGVDRVNTALEIINEHLGRAAAGPPNDNDPDRFKRDMANHARRHLENGRKYVEKVKGKMKKELQKQLDEAEKAIDDLIDDISQDE